MEKEYSSHFIFTVFVIMAALPFSAWGAHAAHADTVFSQISIAGNGQTIAKHATVISVSGTTIVVETGWGSTKLRWTLETTGSTNFYPNGKSRDMLAAIKPGDDVSFSGLLNDASAVPTIRAAVVRNHTLLAQAEVARADEVPAIPDTEAEESVASSTATPDSNQLLLIAATSTGLLGWLWKYLYGDPAALSRR